MLASKISMSEAFIQARDTKVVASIKRQAERAKRHRQSLVTRQVAEYLKAAKVYMAALKVAPDDLASFSPEAARYVVRKHDEIRGLLIVLEEALKQREAA